MFVAVLSPWSTSICILNIYLYIDKSIFFIYWRAVTTNPKWYLAKAALIIFQDFHKALCALRVWYWLGLETAVRNAFCGTFFRFISVTGALRPRSVVADVVAWTGFFCRIQNVWTACTNATTALAGRLELDIVKISRGIKAQLGIFIVGFIRAGRYSAAIRLPIIEITIWS